jgi:hypothetical protein
MDRLSVFWRSLGEPWRTIGIVVFAVVVFIVAAIRT